MCLHYLHVPDKLLGLGQPASVGKQRGVVLLLRDVEVILFVLRRDGAVIVSIPGNTLIVRNPKHWLASWHSQDCLRDVEVLPPGGWPVHKGLSLIQLHELLVWVPMVRSITSHASVQTETRNYQVSIRSKKNLRMIKGFDHYILPFWGALQNLILTWQSPGGGRTDRARSSGARRRRWWPCWCWLDVKIWKRTA